MPDDTNFGVLVMDDGGEFGDVACARAVQIGPASARLAREGTPQRHGLPTVAVLPPRRFTVQAGVAAAAAEGLWWVSVPRGLSDPLTMLVDAATGAAKALSEEHPGYAVGFFGPEYATTTRIAAVADLRDPVTTGLSAWAAVGLAIRLNAELDVFVLGASESEERPVDPQEAMQRFQIKGRGWRTTAGAVERAVSHGVQMQWVPLGVPADPAAAILNAVAERGCGIVVEDLPPLQLGPWIGRRRRVQTALTGSDSAAQAYRLLRDAPCGVVVVVDAIRMGLLPQGFLKSSAAAALALGVLGASTGAAASPGVSAANEMPQAFNDAAAAETAPPDSSVDLDKTAEDLAVLQHDLAVATAVRDATAEELAAANTELAATQAQLALEQEALEALVTYKAPVQEAADDASAQSTRLSLQTLGPLSILPFTPSQEQADQAQEEATQAQEELQAVADEFDAVQDEVDRLDAQRLALEEQIAEANQALGEQQPQVDLLAQQTADLAWALHPVTIPVVGDAWEVTAKFGVRGWHWSGGVHLGLDFAGPVGTPIVAAKSGVVIEAGWGGAYGRTVVIQHEDGTLTRYAHLHEIIVAEGQWVVVGEQIGTLGNTGNSTGPHLHFEVIDPEGNFIDPGPWLGLW